MTASYEKQDLKFIYPENWTLTQNDDQDLPWEVSLETPSGALFSINVFQGGTDRAELVAGISSALSEQYEDAEITQTTEPFHGHEAIGADAFFYCLDFLVSARVRVIETDTYVYVFFYQAESREFDTNEKVFQAIAVSVLQNASMSTCKD